MLCMGGLHRILLALCDSSWVPCVKAQVWGTSKPQESSAQWLCTWVAAAQE